MHRRMIVGVLVVVALVLCSSAARTTGMTVTVGCAMAHCDPMLSGNIGVVPPIGTIRARWHDTTVAGSGIGLGCASNSSIAVCSLRATTAAPTAVKTYRADGSVAWSSTALNQSAAYSAPIVQQDGSVIAADNERVMRFNPDGSIAWTTEIPGGTPISPTMTDNSAVVLATAGGPISAYDQTTGALLAQLTLTAALTDTGTVRQGIYDTLNTPTVWNNRIYISTQFRELATGTVLPYGRLYAVDFLRFGSTGKLSVAWFFDFQAPSGGSPLLVPSLGDPVIYFDGNGIVPGGGPDPHLFAVVDKGDHGEVAWSFALATDPKAAAAHDPRGGVWTFAPKQPYLYRLEQATGTLLQRFNVDTLVNQPGTFVPGSTIMIAGTNDKPVMLLSVTTIQYTAIYLVAVDLTTNQVLWKIQYDEGKGFAGLGLGQFPIILDANGQPVIVATSNKNGVWGFGP